MSTRSQDIDTRRAQLCAAAKPDVAAAIVSISYHRVRLGQLLKAAWAKGDHDAANELSYTRDALALMTGEQLRTNRVGP
jgi:hypothetical protein